MNYPIIDITAWTQVGEGGNGITYVHPDNPDIMLKVNKSSSQSDETAMKREMELSQHVFALGLPTPRMYEMVRVGDSFGLTFECIKDKQSLARICADNPQRMAEAAALLDIEGKKLHSTPCDTNFFPNRKELTLKAIETVDFVSESDKAKMRSFVQSLADETTCIHGDFQPGNLIVAGEGQPRNAGTGMGKPYWIDLGGFSYGSQMFDFGHLFLVCQVYSQFPTTQDIFHMDQEQLKAFWDTFATAHTGLADHAAFDAEVAKFAPLDVCLRSMLNPFPAANQMFAHVVHTLVENYYR